MKHTLKYQTGEEIQAGDHVLFHGNLAKIEFVAVEANDPEIDWYFSRYGGGVMVSDPNVSGRTFISAQDLAICEDLKFVSRAIACSN